MITKRIVIVGVGNIGSRHLQALAKLPYDLKIDLVEKQEKNLQLAISRLKEISYDKNKLEWFHYNDIEELSNPADLVIVATNSPSRVELTVKLLNKGYKYFLLEKIITQSEIEYKFLLKKFKEKGAHGWVDVSRIYFDSYQNLKDYFKNSDPIHISVNCGNLGLGCNAIQFISLFSFFVDDYKVNLNGNMLFDKILPNKRGNQFVEFAGTITAKTKNGSSLSVTFSPHEDLPFYIEILGKKKHVLVEEISGFMVSLLDKKPLNFDFKFEYQSTLSTKIVNDIIKSNSCILPTLEESSFVHYELFRIFNAHIKKIQNKEVKQCPIT